MTVHTARPVAGGRLASLAQPPRATPFFPHRLSSRHKPQPFPSASFPDTPEALRESHRCFLAFRPLLARVRFSNRPSLGARRKP